jgi:hypothetical protein
MNRLILFLILTLLFFSCKEDKRSTIVGTWRAVEFENSDIDSFFIKSKLFIDSMGGTQDPEINVRLYGTTNMDSLREVMRQQYDSAWAVQRRAVTNTVFKFRDDSVAVLSFNGGIDSGKWFFKNERTLMIDPSNKAEAAEKVEMEVLALSDTVLRLRLMEENSSSTVTFRPER